MANQAYTTQYLADIPSEALIQSQNASGTCITNVDGKCISGGRRIAGSSGYDMAGLEGKETCSAFPLFCTTGIPYTTSNRGYLCSVNANSLKDEVAKW